MPILDANSLEYISRSVEATRRAGMRLGALLRPGDLICLVGDLGSGKTTLVQGIATGWGSLDQVSSPTFVLVNVYRRFPESSARSSQSSGDPAQVQELFHLDAYRLSGPQDAEDLDLDSLLERGPLIIEWADRIQDVLPPEHLRINLSYVDPTQRDMLLSANGKRYNLMLNAFRRQSYRV